MLNLVRYIAFIRSLGKKRDHTVSLSDPDCICVDGKDAEMILKAVGEYQCILIELSLDRDLTM
jgi:hypothetical protein